MGTMLHRYIAPGKPTMMYKIYRSLKKEYATEWGFASFEEFASAVGCRRGTVQHLQRQDPTKPYGPGNANWGRKVYQRKGRRVRLHRIEFRTYYTVRHFHPDECSFQCFEQFFEAVGERPEGMVLRRHDDAKPFASGNVYWGKKPGQRTHGMSHTPEHKAWRAAKRRCSSTHGKDFENYNSLGVRVTLTFTEFFAEIGYRPDGTSLDRINPYANYCRGNIRWASQSVQGANQRNSPCNRAYRAIYEGYLDAGMSPAEASALCVPIADIERVKGSLFAMAKDSKVRRRENTLLKAA